LGSRAIMISHFRTLPCPSGSSASSSRCKTYICETQRNDWACFRRCKRKAWYALDYFKGTLKNCRCKWCLLSLPFI